MSEKVIPIGAKTDATPDFQKIKLTTDAIDVYASKIDDWEYPRSKESELLNEKGLKHLNMVQVLSLLDDPLFERAIEGKGFYIANGLTCKSQKEMKERIIVGRPKTLLKREEQLAH